MRRVILFFVILSTCGLSFGASETVILLSWDGMRHDFLDRGDFPALKQVEQQGIRAKKLTPRISTKHLSRPRIAGNRRETCPTRDYRQYLL